MPKFLRPIITNSPLLGLLIILLLAPAFISNQYVLQIMIFAGLYIVLVLSLNLLNGYVGLLAIGHAAFYGIGAYASAKLSIEFGLPFLVTVILAGFITGGFGYLVGRPTLNLSGVYLALATLGFNVIVWLVLLNWMGFTNGPLGIMDIPQPNLFGYEIESRTDYYYLILAMVVFTLFTMHRLVTSRFGQALVAIREDELAAKASGIDTTKYKVQAFVISAFYAGLAGAFYAHFVKYISPDSFTHMESFTILAMLALGGGGNLIGPVMGAVILSVVPELFRFLQEYRMFVYGGILVGVMLIRPSGLFGGRQYSFKLKLFDEKEKTYDQGDKFLKSTSTQSDQPPADQTPAGADDKGAIS